MGKRSLFGRNKAIESQIDDFLDKVSEAGLVFTATIRHEFEHGTDQTAAARIAQVLQIKRAANRLRRQIEAELYTEMLIPDLLGDVAGLIESLDRLVERMHHAMRFRRYSPLERPPAVLAPDGRELATAVGHAVESLVLASRAFFRDFTRVRDHVHKVGFHESECDELRDRLLETLYASEFDLAVKDHVAGGIREIDEVANDAERIADWLTIYAIKRAE